MLFLDKAGRLFGWQQILKTIKEESDSSDWVLLSYHKYFLCFCDEENTFLGEYNADKNYNVLWTKKGNQLFLNKTTIEKHPDFDFNELSVSEIDENFQVTLKIGDKFLTAFPNGELRPEGTIAQNWEKFLIVPLKYAKIISDSLRNSAIWAAQHNVILDFLSQQGWEQDTINIIGQNSEKLGNINVDVVSFAYGRLGNNLVQYLNAIIIGLSLNSRHVSLFKPRGMSVQGEFQIADTKVRVREDAETSAITNSPNPKLIGNFFAAKGFEAAFSQVSDRTLLQCISEVSKILPSEEGSCSFDPTCTLLMHIRGGDIFMRDEGIIHPWYAQPPAAFYIKAALDAEKFGVDNVLIVTDGYLNPTVAYLVNELPKYGFKVSVQSDSILRDFSSLRQARYLAKSNGTFSEMPAMFSDNLRYLWCFEQISSQFGQGEMLGSVVAIMTRIFQLKKVHCIVGYDSTNRATPMGQWAMSAKQHALLTELPVEAIALKSFYNVE